MKVMVVIHLPMWHKAGTLSNLRKIVELDAVPRAGDLIALPGNRTLAVTEVKFRVDGHVSVHIMDFKSILEMTTDGGAIGVAELAEDFRAAGYTGITQWDQDLDA